MLIGIAFTLCGGHITHNIDTIQVSSLPLEEVIITKLEFTISEHEPPKPMNYTEMGLKSLIMDM